MKRLSALILGIGILFRLAAEDGVLVAENGFLPLLNRELLSERVRSFKLKSVAGPGDRSFLEISRRPGGKPFALRGALLMVGRHNSVRGLSLADAEALLENKFRVWPEVDLKIKTVYAQSGFFPERSRGIVTVPDAATAAEILKQDVAGVAVLNLTEAEFRSPEVRFLEVDRKPPDFPGILSGAYPLSRKFYIHLSPNAPPAVQSVYRRMTSPSYKSKLLETGAVPLL